MYTTLMWPQLRVNVYITIPTKEKKYTAKVVSLENKQTTYDQNKLGETIKSRI